MRKLKRFGIKLVVLAAVAISIFGCGKEDSERIVGTWAEVKGSDNYQNESLIFFSDGTGYVSGGLDEESSYAYSFEYFIENGTLKFNVANGIGVNTVVSDYEFKGDNKLINSMKAEDGSINTTKYERVK